MPYLLNRGPNTEWAPCEENSISKFYCLEELDYKLDDMEDGDKLWIAFKRSFANIVITLIFFGICTNAIATTVVKKTAFSGGSIGTGQAFKELSLDAKPAFLTMAYMAIIIIIINVISNLFMYFNCDDKLTENRYWIRSFIVAQYNIVFITLVGLIILAITKQTEKYI